MRLEVSVNNPYLLHIRYWKFDLTIYRRGTPLLCISWALHYPARGGAKEYWARWVLWQEKPWRRFYFWRQPMKYPLEDWTHLRHGPSDDHSYGWGRER